MIYLDHAASTPVLPEVAAAMRPWLLDECGNPSSLHAAGRRARKAVEDARETVAGCLEGDPREIIFTSGATESNALALEGAAEALRSKGDHVITAAAEHASVLETCERLGRRGFRVTVADVDGEGRVNPDAIARAMTPRTILVSVQWVNNEVGTVQPIREIRRASKGALLHTDAAQALGKVPVSVAEVDLLTFSAHKAHGPKGSGGLWVRRGTPLAPLLSGGGQEFERRAGTENVAGIVGTAEALRRACGDLAVSSAWMESLRERLRLALKGAMVHGPARDRAPHLLNVAFGGADGEAMVLALDAAGVCVSTGSACASLSALPSHVLKAMGVPPEVSKASLRFSVSSLTTEAEVDEAGRIVARVLDRLRAGVR